GVSRYIPSVGLDAHSGARSAGDADLRGSSPSNLRDLAPLPPGGGPGAPSAGHWPRPGPDTPGISRDPAGPGAHPAGPPISIPGHRVGRRGSAILSAESLISN